VAGALGVAFVGYLVGTSYLVRSRRLAAGLGAESMSTLVVRSVIIAAFVAGGILALAQDRGVPLSLAFLVGLVVLMDHVAKRTRFGRMVFAVGGSREAARRAGIPVSAVRVAVFALASTCAAWGGVLAASRLLAVNQSAGSGDVLLNAIAAAVIGGTSLFGGRGTVWAALRTSMRWPSSESTSPTASGLKRSTGASTLGSRVKSGQMTPLKMWARSAARVSGRACTVIGPRPCASRRRITLSARRPIDSTWSRCEWLIRM